MRLQKQVIEDIPEGSNDAILLDVTTKTYNEGKEDEYSYVYFNLHFEKCNQDCSMSCSARILFNKEGEPKTDLANTLVNLGVSQKDIDGFDSDILSEQLKGMPVKSIGQQDGKFYKITKISKA